MWSTGVLVQIASIAEVLVATGVGVETAFVPSPAATCPDVMGSMPVAASVADPFRTITATVQSPATGTSSSAAKSPGIGL